MSLNVSRVESRPIRSRLFCERIGQSSDDRGIDGRGHRPAALVRPRQGLVWPVAWGHFLFEGQFQILFSNRHVFGIERSTDAHPLVAQNFQEISSVAENRDALLRRRKFGHSALANN
jgi:hypothetical protein